MMEWLFVMYVYIVYYYVRLDSTNAAKLQLHSHHENRGWDRRRMSSRTTCAWEVPCEPSIHPSIHMSYMMTDRQMEGWMIGMLYGGCCRELNDRSSHTSDQWWKDVCRWGHYVRGTRAPRYVVMIIIIIIITIIIILL